MIPFWLKICYSIFVAVVIPIYYKKWGLANFLWLSDVTFILTAVSLWTENKLIAGTIAVTGLLPELFWNVIFFVRLLTGKSLSGHTDYMFDKSKPLYLRLLSLFHVILPPLMIYLLFILGYDSRSLAGAIILTAVIFLTTYLFTDPHENINSVFGTGKIPQANFHPTLYVLLYFAGFVLLVFLPTHFLCQYFFG